MSLQRVWQTEYNRISFRVREIIVRINFRACNRISLGKLRAERGFTLYGFVAADFK
jgi:hypothetical protein